MHRGLACVGLCVHGLEGSFFRNDLNVRGIEADLGIIEDMHFGGVRSARCLT